MFELRDYQKEIVSKGDEILMAHGFLYLAMEVRTGKTFTALAIADLQKPKNVLCLTKKKAISSITDDYNTMAPGYAFTIINYESMHKLPDTKWDLIIIDEAHSLGKIPKPSKRAKDVKSLIMKHDPMVILMSGTPTPENFSQMYHQVYAIPTNPFSSYKTFYKFAAKYVKVTQRKINSFLVNDYSNGLPTIKEAMSPFTIEYSQEMAGFTSKITEEILSVEMKPITYKLCKTLKKDKVIMGASNDILADTPVKLMMKLHQMFSGTVKFESGESMILDDSKALFIAERFKGQKIGIFYKFTEEYNTLKKVFGDGLTNDLDEFNSTDKNIALQIVSGREGVSLKNAESLVFYTIDFSATSYWQARDRMTTKDRLNNKIYWIFARDGIEYDIHKAVSEKKRYTKEYFENSFLKK